MGLVRCLPATGVYGNITYSYDDVGNRQTKIHTENGITQTQTYTYAYEDTGLPTTSHQLGYIDIDETGQASVRRNIAYDDNGNAVVDDQAGDPDFDLAYNSHQRYEQLDISSTPTAWYQHNALGQRVRKATLTDVVHYHYDEAGQLLAQTDGTGQLIKEYIYADCMRVARATSNGMEYLHNDHLGRPMALTDTNQNIVWQADYLPFGEVRIVTNNTVDQELGFPGQVLDSESGFWYNYFRDYDPATGRYVQSDPRGILLDFSEPQRQIITQMGLSAFKNSNIGGLNHLYGYGPQSPLIYIDSTGEGWIAIANAIIILYIANDIIEKCREKCPDNTSREDNAKFLQCVVNLKPYLDLYSKQ